MYLRFAPKIKDFYEVEVLSFELENTQNSGIFSMEVSSQSDFLKTLRSLDQSTRCK